jgi:ankyrin repeat protein
MGADTEETDSNGLTPLLIAAQNKRMVILRLLLGKSNIHAQDNKKRTVLHHALFGLPGEDAIGPIVQYGADVNAMDSEGKRPLHYCVKYNKKRAAQILIDNGAEIEAENKAKETAALLAAKTKNFEFMELLHKSGAKFDRRRIPRDFVTVRRFLDAIGAKG